MNEKVEELISFTKEELGLDDYYLKSDQLYRNVNIYNETVYILNMEWFPNKFTEHEDDLNPEGTAIIDIEIHSRRFQSIIFVGDKSYAKGLSFYNVDLKDIIKRIERKTNLIYGKDFKIHKEVEREYHFIACIDGIVVSPSQLIEVRFDQKGNLIFFAVYGQFTSERVIKEETYTLSLEKVEHLIKEQLKLVEFPSFEQEILFPIYAIEEIYVTNDSMSTIPFEFIVNEKSYLEVDQTIYWDTPINKQFERLEIELMEDISAEQALLCEQSQDSFPITMDEQEACIVAVKDFLRQEYEDDTGKWMIKTLHRDNGYIHAILRLNQQDNSIFKRKLTIMIDDKSFEALNFVDNKMMLEMFRDFQPPENVITSQEEAYIKIKKYIELKPYYVYDIQQREYVLCGKLDCQYGVNAANGEVLLLEDL